MSGAAHSERGFALVAVLLVLMALFVLTAPFLLSVTGADRASVQAADRAAARLALDSALRHARGKLGATHPAVDTTPYHDSLEELALDDELAPEFLDPADPRGVMWNHEAQDLAGLVDLASAPPQVIANLLGAVSRLTLPAEADDERFQLASASGFLDEGYLWVDGELVHHGGRDGASLTELTRGLGVTRDEDGDAALCGPRPAAYHDLGTWVLDQRAFALHRWRVAEAVAGELPPLDSVEQLARAVPFAMAGELGPGFLDVLARTGTAHGGVGAGPAWQAPVRIVAEPSGEPEPGCVLLLSSARAFNPGTLVRIRDGAHVELGLVRSVSGNSVRLAEPLQRDYRPHTAVVEAQARRPVNLNTAGPEVLRALFVNLKLVGSSSRITPREAEALVEAVVVSRPFTGFEDFLRRLVLPAGGLEELPEDAHVVPSNLRSAAGGAPEGLIDADDARALYYNARNANDARLEYATMPFAFTSRGLHRLDLRAAVNARSGVERAHARREQVEAIVPQRSLLQVWARQEDYDEAPRLTLDAPGWASGPAPTGRPGSGGKSPWPSRARAHLGPHAADPIADAPGALDASVRLGKALEVPRYTFASREEDGWIQPAPARVDDLGARRGNVLHFDDETESLEGHYLADGPLSFASADFGWAGASGWLRPLAFRAWIQPLALQGGARLLDVGGSFTDSDAIRLELDGQDLVLRVLDGGGDHPDTEFVEVGEVRYSLAEGPGLPTDVWSHVELGVSGNRPDQMRLLVDGRWPTTTPGLTRLAGGLGPETTTIPVESTEGFPDRCVLRIGDELVEAVKSSATSFDATHHTTGELAGFGGRLARELYGYENGQGLPLALATVESAHPAGTPVQHYGYSLPLRSNVPNTGGQLGDLRGPFGVARAVGIQRGNRVTRGQPVVYQTREAVLNEQGQYEIQYDTLGTGLLGSAGDVSGIQLASLAVESGRSTEDVMTAFSGTGGYAVLCSVLTVEEDTDGYRIGGVEVVRYTGWQGDVLLIDRRGDQIPELQVLDTGNDEVTGRKSFVFHWDGEAEFVTGQRPAHQISSQTLVFPISVPVPGASDLTSFVVPAPGRSELAQITRLGANAELTEWVRYDEIVADHLVRDDPYALGRVLLSLQIASGLDLQDPSGFRTTPSTRGGNGSSAAGPGARPIRSPPPRSPQGLNRYWSPQMGEPEVETEDNPITRAISSTLQFRGVMGTFSHAHGGDGSVQVLPVWKVTDVETLAQPGRLDAVVFLDEDPSVPGFPAIVHRAHRPHQYLEYPWSDEGTLEAEVLEPETHIESGLETDVVYVALQEPLAVPFAPSATSTAATGQPALVDTRTVARLTKFPSGEMPREAPELRLGGAVLDGAVPAPSLVVDEAQFLADRFDQALVLRGTAPPLDAPEITESELKLSVREILRTPAGEVKDSEPLAFLRSGGGLLRIGDEILCYRDLDVNGDVVVVAPGGRGMLGTTATAHVEGESLYLLESWRATTLAVGVQAGSAELPVVSTAGFPPEGTLLVGEELIHYTHLVGSRFAMPRASEEPGAQDRQGGGLFRGRFGTTASAHAADTPVILWPFRYWDRWSERADAPELHYHGLSIDQPDALWRRVFWNVEPPAAPGTRLGVLQRTDARLPWDGEPETLEGLDLMWRGRLEAAGNPIVRQSDRIEWRVFLDYEPGAFDARTGLAHGWKCVPRLRVFGAEYLAPGRVLRRVER